MKTIKAISGIFALFLAGQAFSAELFRDDFDGDWTSVKCPTAERAIASDPDGIYRIHNYDDFFGCVNIYEANGEMRINTANSPNAAIGGGFVTLTKRPEFNFFGPETVDAANPHKRVFRFSNFRFEQQTPLQPQQKSVSFVVAKSPVSLHTNNRFEVILHDNNYIAIYSTGKNPLNPVLQVANTLFYSPVARVPVKPHSVEIELGPTDYKVTFLFNGGGLYFEGQHLLDRASWEESAPDANGNPTAENFYVGALAGTFRPYDLETMVDFYLDSLVVTDGQ